MVTDEERNALNMRREEEEANIRRALSNPRIAAESQAAKEREARTEKIFEEFTGRGKKDQSNDKEIVVGSNRELQREVNRRLRLQKETRIQEKHEIRKTRLKEEKERQDQTKKQKRNENSYYNKYLKGSGARLQKTFKGITPERFQSWAKSQSKQFDELIPKRSRNGRSYVVLSNGKGRFISKSDYARDRRRGRIPKAAAVYSEENYYYEGNKFHNELDNFKDIQRRTEGNRRYNELPANYLRERLHERMLENERRRTFGLKNSLMKAHINTMLSPSENAINFTDVDNSILKPREDNNILRKSDISILKTGRPSVLSPQNNNILRAAPLNFGMVNVSNDQPQNNQKKREIPARLSFW